MKKLFYLIIAILSIISCENNDVGKTCNYDVYPIDVDIQSNAIIPLHTQNFWVYNDSLWENGVFQDVKSTLLVIDEVMDLEGIKSMSFSTIIPRLTLRNDTLFSTKLTPDPSFPECYELLYPMFFSTTDTIQVDEEPSTKIVYRSTIPIETSLGIYSDNVVYKDGDVFEVVIYEQLGIIKMSFFALDGNNQPIKRRTLTLKDYDLI